MSARHIAFVPGGKTRSWSTRLMPPLGGYTSQTCPTLLTLTPPLDQKDLQNPPCCITCNHPFFPSRSNPQPIKDGWPGRGRPGHPAEEPKRGNPVPAPFGKGSPPHEPQRPRRRVRKTRGHRSYMAGISAFTPAASLPQMVPGRGTASPPRPATQSAFSPAERQKPRSDTEVKIEKISEMESGGNRSPGSRHCPAPKGREEGGRLSEEVAPLRKFQRCGTSIPSDNIIISRNHALKLPNFRQIHASIA